MLATRDVLCCSRTHTHHAIRHIKWFVFSVFLILLFGACAFMSQWCVDRNYRLKKKSREREKSGKWKKENRIRDNKSSSFRMFSRSRNSWFVSHRNLYLLLLADLSLTVNNILDKLTDIPFANRCHKTQRTLNRWNDFNFIIDSFSIEKSKVNSFCIAIYFIALFLRPPIDQRESLI